jgi:glucarate dehydratase
VSDLLGGAVRDRVPFSAYLFYKWAGHPGAQPDDWGPSMHSNSHLGISLAAMVHLAGATPNLTYACDTHWPWKTEDVVAGEPLRFRDGALAVPTGPGLGVRLDPDRLGELHEQYLRCGIRDRDDTAYRRSLEPGYAPRTW